jgi:hypothetical protein
MPFNDIVYASQYTRWFRYEPRSRFARSYRQSGRCASRFSVNTTCGEPRDERLLDVANSVPHPPRPSVINSRVEPAVANPEQPIKHPGGRVSGLVAPIPVFAQQNSQSID